MRFFGMTAAGLSIWPMCRISESETPSTLPQAPPMIWSTSRCPRVVRTPARDPRPVTSRLVTTVDPCRNSFTCDRNSPIGSCAESARALKPLRMPTEKSGGVDDTFAWISVPPEPTATQSVNVPPVSIAATNS